MQLSVAQHQSTHLWTTNFIQQRLVNHIPSKGSLTMAIQVTIPSQVKLTLITEVEATKHIMVTAMAASLAMAAMVATLAMVN